MKLAHKLATAAKGKTFPNPAVGAVIVQNDQIIGTGATQKCGGSHAEKVALMQAGESASGATLYVTLEPCCHFGRTPPCTDAVIAAGIKKVIISVQDPNPVVSGKGITQLQNNGIEVITGVMEKESTRLNEDFFWSITKKRAWITLKLALTLDGRIADVSSSSKWITGEDSRIYVHELRRCHSAVAVGRSTFEIDNPQLNVRHKKGYFPARIIFSSDETITKNSYFYQNSHETRSIIVIRGRERSISVDQNSGIEFWYTGQKTHKESLRTFLEMAHQEGLSSIFVEGGQRIGSVLLEAGLVNRVYLFYGNRVIGDGKAGILFSSGLAMNNCISLDKLEFKTFKQDIMITGIPQYSRDCA